MSMARDDDNSSSIISISNSSSNNNNSDSVTSEVNGKNTSSIKQGKANTSSEVRAEDSFWQSYTRFSRRTFIWSEWQKVMVLASFFVSFILLLVPGGSFVSKKQANRGIILFTQVACAIVTLLTAFISDYFWLVTATRTLLGALQAFMLPAIFSMINLWLPLADRSLGLAVIDFGGEIGIIATFAAGSYLINRTGWASLFIFSALLTAMHCVLFASLASDAPSKSRFIRSSELLLLNESTSISLQRKLQPIPWVQIVTNRPFIAAAVFKFGCIFNFRIFYAKLPLFLKDQNIDICSHGLLLTAIAAAFGVSLILSSYTSERIIESRIFTRTVTRKVFSIFTGFANAICLIAIPICVYFSSFGTLYIVILTSSLLFGCSGGSDIPLAAEISRQHSILIFSMINLFASTTGILVPAFVAMVDMYIDDCLLAWSVVFFSSGGLLITCFIVFATCASAERQSFDFVSRTSSKCTDDDSCHQVSC